MFDNFDTPKKNMLIALKKSLGVIATACKKANVSRQTHYNWLKNDEAYKIEVENIEEEALDFTESKLFELIKGVKLPETKVFQYEGEIITHEMKKVYPPDTTAVIFHLKTKGKKRGYVEKTESDTHVSGGLNNTNKHEVIFKKFSKDD